MKKYLLVILILIMALYSEGQILRNDGKINVAGGFLVISGNYQNESSAGITLDGTIAVSGNWTNNGSTNVIETPGTNGEVIFNGTGTQIIDGTASLFDFEKLTINSGSKTEVAAGKGLTAYGACTFTDTLILRSTTTAFRPQTATFINQSTVSGNITMELSYTSTGSSAAGVGRGLYFSSPISNATSTIFNVAAGINLLWYQNEILRQYVKVTANNTPLTVAKGYILRSPTTQVFNFSGTPNTNASYFNNNIPRAVAGQFYLMGNPYQSVVDWDLMTKTNLSSTIWYQTSTPTGSMVVDTWNGSVGTNNNTTANVDGKIPPMQSFWVQCSSVGVTGSLTIDNTNRTHDWGNSQFIKGVNSNLQNLDYIRFYLYTNETKRDEAIVLQTELADDILDDKDSRKMLLKDGVRAEMYTLSPEKTNLVIQSVKPIIKDKQIKLGISIGTSGQYKLIANHDNSLNTCNVFLEDKTTKTMQDLLLNPEFVFNASAGDDTSRFVLHYLAAPLLVTKSTIATCSPDKVDLTSSSVTEGSAIGLTYSYWTDKAATVPLATPSEVDAGIYYIKATATNGSYKISEPISVIVEPKPTISINTPTPVCEPQTIDLTSTDVTSGSTNGLVFSYWTDINATVAYNTPTAAIAGNYYIKGTTESGCYAISEVVSVVINSKPTVQVSNPTAVCEPQTIDLTSEAITTGSSSGLTFTYWNDIDATIPVQTPNSVTSGNYFIKGTTDKGCYSVSDPITVSINPKPALIINSPAPVCDPQTINLTLSEITAGSSDGLTYSYWTDKDATVSYTTPIVATAGNYYIKGTSEKGCYTISDAVTVTINPRPTVYVTNPPSVIYPSTVDITASFITAGSSPGLTYSYWLDASANNVYTTPQTAVAGNYYIMGTNNSTGCFTIAGPVVVTVLTSSENSETNKVSIYTVKKSIVIENCELNTLVTIYDITGKELLATYTKSNKEVIQFNHNSGIYIVRLVDSKNIKSGKVYLQ